MQTRNGFKQAAHGSSDKNRVELSKSSSRRPEMMHTSCSWQRDEQNETRAPTKSVHACTGQSDVIPRLKQIEAFSTAAPASASASASASSSVPLLSQHCVMIGAALERKVLSRARITDDFGYSKDIETYIQVKIYENEQHNKIDKDLWNLF